MTRIQKVCGKASLMCLKGLYTVLAPINEVKEILIHIRFGIVHRYQKYA